MTPAELSDLERRVARMEADSVAEKRAERDAPIVARARQLHEAHVEAHRAEESRIDRVLGCASTARDSSPRFDPSRCAIRMPTMTPAAARAIAARAEVRDAEAFARATRAA